MSACKGCQIDKPTSDFYAYRPRVCKECVKTSVKANYADNRVAKSAYERARTQRPDRKAAQLLTMKKHRALNPDKYKARTAVNNALRDRRLTRGQCRCGSLRVQAHHHDYSKPLDVIWVCFKCHREDEHGQTVVDAPIEAAPVPA